MIKRRNIEGLAGLCVILYCLIGLVLGGCSTSESKGMDIYPEKALIIFTQENWGCLVGQKLKEDVTALVTEDDGQFARLDEIKNPEDVDNRYELYLSFPAKEIDGLPGYYVLKLYIEQEEPMEDGHLLIDQAKIVDSENGYSFRLKAKTKGMFLWADLLYGKHSELKEGFFSCPDADLYEPQEMSFFSAYEVYSDLDIHFRELPGGWSEVDIPIDSFFLEEGRLVDQCEELLDVLDEELSAFKGLAFLWADTSVTIENIERIVSQMEHGKTFRYSVSTEIIEEDSSEELNISGEESIPVLRQRITVIKKSNGQPTGGQVWIGIVP